MSARRDARARDVGAIVARRGGIPRPLLVGACIEVWGSPPTAEVPDQIHGLSARIRFGEVRRWWLEAAGIEDREASGTIPPRGSAWSVEYLSYRGQAERSGLPLNTIVAERLGRAGATVSDLDDLKEEATHLHDLAVSAADNRKRR